MWFIALILISLITAKFGGVFFQFFFSNEYWSFLILANCLGLFNCGIRIFRIAL